MMLRRAAALLPPLALAVLCAGALAAQPQPRIQRATLLYPSAQHAPAGTTRSSTSYAGRRGSCRPQRWRRC